MIDGEIVGRISLRHELNEFLKVAGGHLGYIVRQSARKKGFASEMLCQVIDTERAKSIFSLLVTCDEDNVGSEKTILRGGFILKDFIEISPDKPRKKRFWRRIGSGT